jgi:Tol biopolymer transport system component
MTRKHISVLVLILILILSAFATANAANFKPPATGQALPTGWHAITDVLPEYTGISNIAISPDSKYVVFAADVDVDYQYELYSMPITGTVPVKLNPPLVSGGLVYNFIITSDSSRVIYWAEQEVDERRELYSVPIKGGAVTKLNGPLPTGGNVQSFKADTNTGQVVYTADQDSNDVYELYSVRVEGGEFVKLNSPLVSGGNVYSYFEIDPISERVVYSADQDTDSLYELYSVPIAGGTAIKLNMPVSAGIVSAFQITPGAAYVMFIAKATGAGASQLYINETAGGVVQKRSHDLNPGEYVNNFRISPDGSQVVYLVTPNFQGGGNLYQTSPFSGEAHVLTVAEPGFGVDYLDFVFTPDGNQIVCEYQYDAGSPKKLMSVKTTGFPVVQADLFVPDNDHFVGIYRISPDSQWVVYEDYTLTSFDNTLRAVPTTGGATVYFGPGVSTNWAITPDSQRVVYISPEEGYPRDLVSGQIFGGGLLNLSHLIGFDIVYDQRISPDGQWIVFAVQLINGNGETVGIQLRASDGTEPPAPSPVFYTYIPLVQR